MLRHTEKKMQIAKKNRPKKSPIECGVWWVCSVQTPPCFTHHTTNTYAHRYLYTVARVWPWTTRGSRALSDPLWGDQWGAHTHTDYTPCVSANDGHHSQLIEAWMVYTLCVYDRNARGKTKYTTQPVCVDGYGVGVGREYISAQRRWFHHSRRNSQSSTRHTHLDIICKYICVAQSVFIVIDTFRGGIVAAVSNWEECLDGFPTKQNTIPKPLAPLDSSSEKNGTHHILHIVPGLSATQ